MRYRAFAVPAIVMCTTILQGMALAQSHSSPLATLATTETNGLEGMDVAQDGTIYVTDATAHVIHKIAPDGSLSEFAKVPGAPQVILLTRGGAVVTAQEREPDFAALRAPSASTGSAAAASALPAGSPPASTPAPRGLSASMMGALGAEIVVLDRYGRPLKTVKGVAGAFFNGIDRFGADYLIADSTAGTIWKYDERRGSIDPWLKDAALLGPNGRFPGANGIKVVKNRVYVANTVAGIIYRINASHGKPQGGLTAIAHVQAPDDFAVALDGTIYLPSEGKVLKVSPSGEISTLAEGCQGCDSALLTDHERSLLLVTHGFGPDSGRGHVYRLKLK
jgi:sugar lactone lactonase YvrE